jgi:cytochrome c oxidase subunit II
MNELMRRILFLPEQSSTFALKVDQLHYFIIIVTMLSSALIGGAGLYFLVRYRRRSELERTPHVEASVTMEALFIGVPLAFFLVWFAIGFRDFVWASNPPRDALDVYVTGKQWMWKFSYPDGPSEIDELHVPAGRPVRLLLTSRDVVHSFFVPDFRIKRDVIPSRYTEAWFEAPKPGTHPVLCTEYCGLDHSMMRAQVIVLEPAAFDAWRAQQRLPSVAMAAPDEEGPLVVRGQKAAAEAGCFKCHSVDGSPHVGPSFLGLYGKEETLTGGGKVLVDEAYITESMMEPNLHIVAGFAPLMPSFYAQLSPGQTAAIIEYIKSLRPQHAEAAPLGAPQ